MRLSIRCATFVAALVTLAGCDSVGSFDLDLGGSGSPAPNNWKVHGTVTEAGTTNPVSRAAVIFADPYLRATSRPDGTYSILSVSEFCYGVRVEAAGYSTWTGKRCVGSGMTFHDFALTKNATEG
jgi:hypothetical protein